MLTVIFSAALATAPSALWADPGGTNKWDQTTAHGQSVGKGKKAKGGAAASDTLDALISAGEHRLIHDYFRQHPYSPDSLPPGIAKNLARGKPLPPGIAKRYLPQRLLRELPPRPGYEWLALGRDVALVVAATGVIVDILRDVF
jgi:Ni/Co efflux regulator RcnB